jgi:putative endonuclease
VGKLGETLAVKYLAKKGFRLVNKNYHIQGGEIDLIMENDGILLFVEVKTRNSNIFGEPHEALNQKKIRKILRAILHYLHENPTHKNWRCDLIAIKFVSPGGAEVRHIINIFDQ